MRNINSSNKIPRTTTKLLRAKAIKKYKKVVYEKELESEPEPEDKEYSAEEIGKKSSIGKKLINKGIDSIPNIFKYRVSKVKNEN